MAVMIGIDPHEGSRTAVAEGAAGQPLGKVCIRACPAQAGQLVTGAAGLAGADLGGGGRAGLGRLGQQRVAAGERVLDVQPKLAARVRLLHTWEGIRGTSLHPGRPAHTPSTGSVGKPLPGPKPAYEPTSRRACHGPHPGPGKQDPENHLTTAKAKRIPIVSRRCGPGRDGSEPGSLR
jgi:hypothetical protein